MVISLSCAAIMSRNALLAKSRLISFPVNVALAMTLRRAPSSSRMFDRIRLPMKNATSLGNTALSCKALLCKMATLVSRSGGSIATVKPQPKRDFNRSSKPDTSFGKRSLERIICCCDSNRALKVWKNSSCERSLPAKNCMSSMSNALTDRYFFLN